MMRSPCCFVAIEVRWSGTMENATHWYACAACGQPCDPVDHAADAGKMVEDQAAEQSRQSNEVGK